MSSTSDEFVDTMFALLVHLAAHEVWPLHGRVETILVEQVYV